MEHTCMLFLVAVGGITIPRMVILQMRASMNRMLWVDVLIVIRSSRNMLTQFIRVKRKSSVRETLGVCAEGGRMWKVSAHCDPYNPISMYSVQ